MRGLRLWVVLGGMVCSVGGTAMGLPEIDRLWNYEDPAGTEAKFRELLPAARAGGEPGYLVELLTQIGRTYSLRGKFKEAHATLDEAEKILGPGKGVPRVRCLLERGRTYNSAGEAGRARGLFVEAWETARAAAEKGDRRAGEFAIDAAHMVAIAEKEPREQLAWNLKALEMAEGAKSPWRASLHNNIGWTYHDMRDYPKALHHLEKALALRKEAGKEPQLRVAKWSVAKLWRLVGRVDEALKVQKELLGQLEAAKQEDGFVSEEMGECLLALGRAEEARPHFRRALELLSKDEWLVKNEGKRLDRLKELGRGAP